MYSYIWTHMDLRSSPTYNLKINETYLKSKFVVNYMEDCVAEVHMGHPSHTLALPNMQHVIIQLSIRSVKQLYRTFED